VTLKPQEPSFVDLARQLPVVDGGIPNFGGLLNSAVRLSADNGHPKGTAACLRSREWLLTAAHNVLGVREVELWASVGDPLDASLLRIKVVEFHWQSGYVHRVGQTKWPAEVIELKGARDELVLLKLDKPFDQKEVAYPALLRLDAVPVKGLPLVVAGWGEDRFSNLARSARAGILRFRGVSRDGRGECTRNPADPFNAMPVQYDSGCPVFLPDWSNPIAPTFFRLIGIHASRLTHPGTAPGEPRLKDIARFLTLDANAHNWIGRVTREKPFGSVAIGKPAQPLSADFTLRNYWRCVKLGSIKDVLCKNANGADTTWAIATTHGSTPTLRADDIFAFFDGSDDDATLTISRDVNGAPKEIFRATCEVGGVNDQRHWLWARDDKRATEFYVFLCKTVGGPRKIHVQVHIDGSSKPRPNPCAISDDQDVPPELCEALAAAGSSEWSEQPDQDDEGDGHEN
jgi:hypothetical protein